jgi:HK97 family phage major capsid protein
MTIQEIKDKRSKLLLDARTIMSGANVTAEQRTQVDAMLADANTLQADAQRLESIEVETRSTSSNSIPRGTPGAEVAETRSADERREATNKALRSYLRGEKFEARDLTVASNGAVTIPVGVTDPKVALKSAGSIYDLVGKLRTSTGEAVKLPLLNDTAQGFVLNSASITTTDPTVGGITISIDDIRMNPILIENSLIQDVSFDLVSFVQKNADLRYTRSVSNWITNGNSSNVGALTGISAGVTSTTTLVLKYADFVNMVAALDPAYQQNAVWTMNLATQGAVASILDSNGRPLFQPFNTSGQSGFTGTILGFPVRTNVYLPNYASVGATAVQFGDYEQAYTLREVEPGIQFKRTDERYIELNKVGFVAFARIGGAVTDAGTHPVLTLTGR